MVSVGVVPVKAISVHLSNTDDGSKSPTDSELSQLGSSENGLNTEPETSGLGEMMSSTVGFIKSVEVSSVLVAHVVGQQELCAARGGERVELFETVVFNSFPLGPGSPVNNVDTIEVVHDTIAEHFYF